MNKLTYGKVVALSLLILVASPALPVVAQDDAEVVVEGEEQVGDAGILPTNPFYFLKEWGRSLRRAVIFDPVRRAEFELGVTEEKARELDEVSGLEGEDEKAIERATLNYEKGVERLKTRLEKLEEHSDNPRVEALLGNLAERAAAHQELIENLRVRYEQFENLRSRFEEARGTIDDTVESASRGVQALERVQDKIRTKIEEGQDNEGLRRVLEVIERTRLRLPGEEDGEEADGEDRPRGDVELRRELEQKFQQFRDEVESTGGAKPLRDIEERFRSQFEVKPDEIRERLDFRQKLNGEELRFRSESRVRQDDGDDDKDDLDDDKDEEEPAEEEDDDLEEERE
ncbi:MAG: DUF5667 domain-containing protein [bacterium]|nr:DUF5667 domain-containing protein [bacterium]MDZ4231194.1 DUF5667 domain-containing protein [Patescibacteria group bacterium]